MSTAGQKRPFLGPRQGQALRYIATRKVSPTRAEIGRRLGITRESAHLLVDKLIAARFVTRTPQQWRNLRVTAAGYVVLTKGER